MKPWNPNPDGSAVSSLLVKDGAVYVSGNFNSFQGGKWYSQFLGFVLNFTDPTQPSMFGQNGPIATLALLMVFTIFIPFIALMTSLSAFKVLSPIMGGDVEIALLSRLI